MIGNETFQGNPVSLDISRSKYHQCPVNSGTFTVGKLVPFYMNSLIMPGTTVKCDLRSLIRTSTPIGVPMDNLYLDVFFFFVPHNLTLSRQSMSPSVNDGNHSWAAFIGAQDGLLNMPTPGEITLPKMRLGGNNFTSYVSPVGGFWDWTGCAMDLDTYRTLDVNPLNFLAYCKIWNDYFRDPNGSMTPISFSISSDYVTPSGYISSFLPAGMSWATYIDAYDLLPACRFHGYFGSALPWPQRNATTVTIPLGDKAPIIASQVIGGAAGSTAAGVFNSLYDSETKAVSLGRFNSNGGTTPDTIPVGASFSQLAADLSAVSGIAVNAFRLYVQEQRWYEALARSGNNTLAELTAGMFNVTPSDAVSNRAELLGSKRIPLNIIQVNSTAGGYSSTEKQVSLGSTGSFSLTNDDSYMFTKSFDTWGSLIGLAVVRADDTFSQGVDRQYLKFNRFDYYFPQMANLGEQSILEKEIYATGVSTKDDAVFGYQEAWAEYRFAPNHVCGLLRPGKSLDYWTFCNNFSSAPSLNGFINATGQLANVDRTLQVASTASGFQFLGQFATDLEIVYPMPTYSIPGLDNHI